MRIPTPSTVLAWLLVLGLVPVLIAIGLVVVAGSAVVGAFIRIERAFHVEQ